MRMSVSALAAAFALVAVQAVAQQSTGAKNCPGQQVAAAPCAGAEATDGSGCDRVQPAGGANNPARGQPAGGANNPALGQPAGGANNVARGQPAGAVEGTEAFALK